MPQGKKMTPEEIEIIRQAYADGVNVTVIAEKLGRSRQGVYNYARKHGFNFKRKLFRRGGKCLKVYSEKQKQEIWDEAITPDFTGRSSWNFYK